MHAESTLSSAQVLKLNKGRGSSFIFFYGFYRVTYRKGELPAKRKPILDLAPLRAAFEVSRYTGEGGHQSAGGHFCGVYIV